MTNELSPGSRFATYMVLFLICVMTVGASYSPIGHVRALEFAACSLVLVVCVVAGVATWRVVGEAIEPVDTSERNGKRKSRWARWRGYRGRVVTVKKDGQWVQHRRASSPKVEPLPMRRIHPGNWWGRSR